MPLERAWVLRVHVPLLHVRAVRRVLAEHPACGRMGAFTNVSHSTLSLERFRDPEGRWARWTAIALCTYLLGATRATVEEIARHVASAHPWKHPVIECIGPDGTFVWMPD